LQGKTAAGSRKIGGCFFSGDVPAGSTAKQTAAQIPVMDIPPGELIPLCHKAEVRFCITSNKSEKLTGKHLQSIAF